MNRSKTPFLPGIQYLRGFAALAVVLYHINGDYHYPIFAYGYLGVQLFFMMSGFLMTELHQPDRGWPAAVRFMRKRLVRIYPAYILAFLPVVLIFALMPGKGFSWHRDPLTILTNLLLIHNPSTSILSVSWTLVYEMMFYAIFCAWVILWRQPLPLLLAGWSVLILINLSFFQLAGPPFLWLERINLYFIGGCLLALLYRRLRPTEHAGWLVAALVVFVLNPFFFQTEWTVFLACSLLCTAAVVYQPPQAPQPVLLTLGNASYAIYLTHVTVIAIVTTFGRHPLMILPLFLVCIAVGVLFHRYLEVPLLAWFNRSRTGLRTTYSTS